MVFVSFFYTPRRSQSAQRAVQRTVSRPFFSNDPATTEIYTLSLHDALPILLVIILLNRSSDLTRDYLAAEPLFRSDRKSGSAGMPRPSSYAVFCLKKKSSDGGFFLVPDRAKVRDFAASMFYDPQLKSAAASS